jgi:mycofactocin biosynthetic radical S-adenosylmethionine protein MftC
MVKKAEHNKAGIQLPALFSFITFRHENVGSILFNPFIPYEFTLDETETFITGMFTGNYSVERIKWETGEHFKLSEEESGNRVNELVKKLNSKFCLHFIDGTPTDAPYIPDKHGTFGTTFFSAPKSVLWDITYACNLSCSHCLTGSGKKAENELTTAQAFTLIDKLAQSKILYVTLVGGEPFMRPDIMEIIAYLAKTGMRTDISTNGVYMPEKIIEKLRDLPIFQIQVSIDGIGENHDNFRGMKGAFKKACDTIIRLRDAGISTYISTTVTSKNIGEIEKIMDLAIELGCDAYKAIPFLAAGRGKINNEQYCLSKQDTYRLSKILVTKQKELEGKLNIYSESTFGFLFDEVKPQPRSNGYMICSAGYDILSIGADGTAFPCPFLHDFPLGNLMELSMDEIWHQSETLEYLRNMMKKDMTGECKTCQYAPDQCNGGCRAAAYLTNKSLNEIDPSCFKELIIQN